MEETCNTVISEAWQAVEHPNPLTSLLGRIQKCVGELMVWNKNVFGNVQVEIKKLEAKLKSVKIVAKRREILCEISTWRRKKDILCGSERRMIT